MCTHFPNPGFDQDPAEYRVRTIEAHRPAFELFQDTCALVEGVISTGRPHASIYQLALDCLFLQVYKSFCGTYVLGVRGHEEDMATLLRRLLEMTAQVEYLAGAGETEAPDDRARRYLDHDPDAGGYWWRGSIRDLFDRIGRLPTYDEDYRLLAQISHAAARRVLPRLREGVVQMRSAESFSHLLVFACRYTLASTNCWNQAFQLIPQDRLETLAGRIMNFRLQPLGETEGQHNI